MAKRSPILNTKNMLLIASFFNFQIFCHSIKMKLDKSRHDRVCCPSFNADYHIHLAWTKFEVTKNVILTHTSDKHKPFLAKVIGVLMVILGFFPVLPDSMPGSNEAFAERCDLFGPQQGVQVHSTVDDKNIISENNLLETVRKSICLLYVELEDQKNDTNQISYNPFFLEVVEKNGNTRNMPVDCTMDPKKNLKIARKSEIKHEMSVNSNDFIKVPPGRGVVDNAINKENNVMLHAKIYKHIPCQNRTTREYLDMAFIKYTSKAETDDLIATFSEQASLSISELHRLAAEITRQFRNDGLACSEAVVIRVKNKGQVGIRICTFDENEKDCRCPVTQKY